MLTKDWPPQDDPPTDYETQLKPPMQTVPPSDTLHGGFIPLNPYLKNGGTLEKAASMANHASTRTTQLYDRRADEVTLDEVERVGI
jgi:hypothetical protein